MTKNGKIEIFSGAAVLEIDLIIFNGLRSGHGSEFWFWLFIGLFLISIIVIIFVPDAPISDSEMEQIKNSRI